MDTKTKTPDVIPFSSSTEAQDWQSKNCFVCDLYENSSTTEKEARCKMAYHIDLGYISGIIPLSIAKAIGCKHSEGSVSVTLDDKCKKFEDALPF